jgi:hypothetical protein
VKSARLVKPTIHAGSVEEGYAKNVSIRKRRYAGFAWKPCAMSAENMHLWIPVLFVARKSVENAQLSLTTLGEYACPAIEG